MKIDFSCKVSFFEKLLVKKVAKICLVHLGQPQNVEISFSMVDENQMQELNNSARGKNAVTDVLSFPSLNLKAGDVVLPSEMFGKNIFLGDIVVCKSQILRQAKEYGATYRQELARMVLHSCLHLLGYDHIDPNDEKVMHAVEIPLYEKITKIKNK